MKVSVLLFGHYALAFGADRVDCDLPDKAQATAKDILGAIAHDAPTLQSLLPTARLAVNHRYATSDQMIHEADEVALIGLVGGG